MFSNEACRRKADVTGEFPLISLVRNFCKVLNVSCFSFKVIRLGDPTSNRCNRVPFTAAGGIIAVDLKDVLCAL